jgi:DNA-directed RNA polymerase specialized sigma24 family protein
MRTEFFMAVFDDQVLRSYLVNIAKAFSKNQTIQEDLLQEAWIRISLAPENKTTEFYMNEGFRAIDNAYHKEWRGWRLVRWGKEHDSMRKRVKYVERKYSTYSPKNA